MFRGFYFSHLLGYFQFPYFVYQFYFFSSLIQCLQRRSNICYLCWVERLRPFLKPSLDLVWLTPLSVSFISYSKQCNTISWYLFSHHTSSLCISTWSLQEVAIKHSRALIRIEYWHYIYYSAICQKCSLSSDKCSCKCTDVRLAHYNTNFSHF